MKSSANSSRSYWVTRPDGMTCQRRPASVIERVGMLGKLHFVIDSRRIEHGLGGGGMSADEGLVIGRLAEFQERAGEARFLEDPITAVRLRVVLAVSLQLLRKLLPLLRSDERALNGEGARHQLARGIGECFQSLLDGREELVRIGAVDDAMVERQTEVRAGPHGDDVLAVGAGEHLGP